MSATVTRSGSIPSPTAWESQPGKGSRFTLSFPDRLVGSGGVSDVAFDYAGGFNRTLLALSDALPPQAFLQRNLD